MKCYQRVTLVNNSQKIQPNREMCVHFLLLLSLFLSFSRPPSLVFYAFLLKSLRGVCVAVINRIMRSSQVHIIHHRVCVCRAVNIIVFALPHCGRNRIIFHFTLCLNQLRVYAQRILALLFREFSATIYV